MGLLVLQNVGVLAGFLPFIAKIMTKQAENTTPAHDR
jgi:hypothetical protein